MPSLSFCRCPHQLLIRRAVFWILMSRSLLIRGRELESSYIFSGWVGVWYGGLEADECFSKNEIIS
jgi:hypothetical protein